jgi:predicted nucleic acid-binding protein
MAKRRAVSPDKAGEVVDAYRRRFPVAMANEEDLSEAISAHQRHNLSFWDAMLWATARRAGCKLILSEDMQDGRTVGGVTVRNPFVKGFRLDAL